MDELLEKKKYDRTYVEIDLEAIKHNIRCEREKVGDKVKIMETRPLSKDKRWRVVEITEKATLV